MAGSTFSTTLTNANIGGWFEAKDGTTINYGIFAESVTGTCTGSPPSTGSCPTAAGFFKGDVAVAGTFVTSDSILKYNVNDIVNGMNIINQLQPKTYLFDTAQFSFMHLHGDLQYGLIAQHMQQILPQCVKNLAMPESVDSLGTVLNPEVQYLGVNYTMLIPILIAGMKEQQQQINDLQAQINNCCNQPRPANNNSNNQQQKTGAIEVELSNVGKIILDQNDPNPFADNTTINYFIPENVSKSQMMFYDNTGAILKSVDIKEKGQGSIMVYGSNLTSGTYSYTLLADGKVIESKKMVKVK